MSPFEEVNREISANAAGLTRRSQVLLLAAASRVLFPRYQEWHIEAGQPDSTLMLLVDSIAAAEHFATGVAGRPAIETLIADLEQDAPSEPTDVASFTAAQDCWILADSAIRTISGRFTASDATWYMLEPMFQTTCQRLFGVSDVGSSQQAAMEQEALEDPMLEAAVGALESSIYRLAAIATPNEDVLASCIVALDALRP